MLVALNEEAKTGVERLSELSNQITKAQAALADVKSRSLALQSQFEIEYTASGGYQLFESIS